jgi:7,8-dihydropterin-6-yl-methyl-4-(beta-D-ribofuranosyl)aminobenzene 5'-phosphate synthase
MIEQLVITQLVENTAASPALLAEHGLSFHIEADGRQLLFDTGQGFVLEHNAKQLDLHLDQVEKIILSHGHYDHAGGLIQTLKQTGPIDLYLHPQALNAKFNRNGKDIGTPLSDKLLQTRIKSRTDTQAPTEIIPGIYVTGEIPRNNEIEDTGGPFYQDSGCRHTDSLTDDQAMYIETRDGLVVLLGCGHAGVVNTLEYIRKLAGNQPVHALLGGMHLLHSSKQRLEFTGNYLQQLQIKYLAPNHCTGVNAICYLRQRFPDTIEASNAGSKHQF